MAYIVEKIDPRDLQPRQGIGIALPFSDRAVFSTTYQSKDAVKANLLNYFLTGKYERRLNPTFGSNLRLFLFEQIDELSVEALEENIKDDLSLYFPRVLPTKINVQGKPDENALIFSMRYKIQDTNVDDEIVIEFDTNV